MVAGTESSDGDAVVGIMVIGIVVLLVAGVIHFFLGRIVLHGLFFIVAMTALFFSNRHYDELAKEETKRLAAQEAKIETQRKEKEKTIKQASKEKILNYLSDLRRAATRLEKNPDSLPNVTMAMNEVIDRIIIDDEINKEIVLDGKVNSQIELLKESLIKLGMEDSEIIKRIDSLKI